MEKVDLETYNKAIWSVTTFFCPIGKDPQDCDGHDCPTKPDSFDDYFGQCLEFLEALQILRKVQNGEMEVK